MTAPDVNADDFAPSEAIMRAQQACRNADKVAYEKGYAAGYRAAHADMAGEVVAGALRHAAKVIEMYDDAAADACEMATSTDCAEILSALADQAALAKFHPTHQEKP